MQPIQFIQVANAVLPVRYPVQIVDGYELTTAIHSFNTIPTMFWGNLKSFALLTM